MVMVGYVLIALGVIAFVTIELVHGAQPLHPSRSKNWFK